MTLDSKKNGKKIIAVLGIPVNKTGKILLTRRHAPKKKFWHNKWQFAGGELEFGESPEQTLAREIKEELDVTATIIYPYPIVKSIVYKKGMHSDLDETVQLILICYLIDIGEQRISFDNDPEKETNSFKWFTVKQALKKDSLPLTHELIKEAEKIIKTNKVL